VPGRRCAEYHHAQRIGWLGLAPRRRQNHTRCLLHPGIGRSSTVLLGSLLRSRVTLRIFWPWFRVNGLLTLDVSTEAEAHGRKHLFGEGMLLPRAETGVER
jgi:hypothetical protein